MFMIKNTLLKNYKKSKIKSPEFHNFRSLYDFIYSVLQFKNFYNSK